ncbi:hypothetical protein T484DRAFT_1821190 [Baffinella frigidus]|nr:hypothetical protein T484DRAFT_1821190 [Cryptophyta sp. CCMP2293]
MECVGMVKGMTAELFREQWELVARLNAMQERIEEDPSLISKTLRKIEWMEEKQRSVARLNKAVASLRCALEADVASGEMVTTAGSAVSSASDELSHDDTESEVSGGAGRKPSDASGSTKSGGSYLNHLQTDLYKAFVTSLDAGFIRLGSASSRESKKSAKAPPREERRILWSKPRWRVRSDDGGQAAVSRASDRETLNDTFGRMGNSMKSLGSLMIGL